MYLMHAMAVYARVEELRARLATERRSYWVNRLEAAVQGGSTSGEILASLGVALDELKDEPWIPADLRSEVVGVLDEVDRLSHPPSWGWNAQLSRYEPPGPTKPVEFSYSLTGQGWAEAYISDGRNWLRPTASYLSDSLRALTDAVDKVVRGRDRVACLWEEEPGNFLWLFEGHWQSVTVEIYWIDRGLDVDALGVKSDNWINVAFEPPVRRIRGQLQARIATKRHDLGAAVVGALDKLIGELGDQGYANRWGEHPFPHAEHESLRQAVNSTP